MLHIFNVFRLSTEEKKAFLIALCLLVVANGYTLFAYGYSTDTTVELFNPNPITLDFFIRQGRYARGAIWLLISKIGIIDPVAQTLYAACAMLMLAFAGILVCRMWRITGPMLMVVVIGFLTLHPYQTEIFTFRESVFYIALAYLLGFLALYLADRKPGPFLVGTALLILALGIYQLILNYLGMAMLFMLVLSTGGQRTFKEELASIRFKPRLLMMICAVIGFEFIFHLSLHLYHVTQFDRSQWLPMSAVSERFGQLKLLYKKMFFADELIMPRLDKDLLLILLVAYFGVATFRLRLDAIQLKTNYLAIPFFILPLAALMIIGISTPLYTWWPEPRVLSAIGLFWAGVIAYASSSQSRPGNNIILAIAAIVMFSFIGVNNHILADQLRQNLRDRLTANRVISRFENMPGFQGMRKLAIVNPKWDYATPMTTTDMDLNMSSLSGNDLPVSTIKDVSGYNFTSLSMADAKFAENYCHKAPSWPAQASITIIQDIGIACLSK